MRNLLLLGLATPALVVACGSTVTTATSGAGASTTASSSGATTTASSSSGAGGEGSSSSSGSASSATSSGASSSTGSSATTSSSTGSSGAALTGCTSDADCNGMTCAELTPGGYGVCLNPVQPATSCQNPGGQNQCCTSADCKAGGCYNAGQVSFCGGEIQGNNECIADGCETDANCADGGGGQICAPAGAFGYPQKECIVAFCRTDADCTAASGGACIPIGGDPCCTLDVPDGLGCAYPGDCSYPGSSCGSHQLCRQDATTGRGACQPFEGCPP